MKELEIQKFIKLIPEQYRKELVEKKGNKKDFINFLNKEDVKNIMYKQLKEQTFIKGFDMNVKPKPYTLLINKTDTKLLEDKDLKENKFPILSKGSVIELLNGIDNEKLRKTLMELLELQRIKVIGRIGVKGELIYYLEIIQSKKQQKISIDDSLLTNSIELDINKIGNNFFKELYTKNKDKIVAFNFQTKFTNQKKYIGHLLYDANIDIYGTHIILHYGEQIQNGRYWNNLTIQMRGIILDLLTGEIVK